MVAGSVDVGARVAHVRAVLLSTGRSTRCLEGRGLTNLLRRAFYPKYEFHKARGKTPKTFETRPVGGIKRGLRRGRQVDGELSRWADSGAKVKHPFARKFVAWCEHEGLVPVASQVCVADTISNVGTLVDLVLMDTRGRLLVVELKCGFGGHYDAASGRMRAPFAEAPDSPRNQHLLQVAFSAHMFKQTFPELGSPRAAIVRVVDGGVEKTPLPRALANAVGDAMKKLKRLK